MKKLLFVLGFLGLLAFPFISQADTVFGFMNGNFYDVKGSLRYACLQDGNCFDYNSQTMTTILEILGVSGTGTITVTPNLLPTITPTPEPTPLQTPSPTPTPIINPTPMPTPTPEPTLKPAYTHDELATKLGFVPWAWPEGTSIQKEPGFILVIPTAQSGLVVPGLTISVDGTNICTEGSTCSTPDGIRTYGKIITTSGDYNYVITYSEDGREDSIITGKITVQ